jgi:hypothetical protein
MATASRSTARPGFGSRAAITAAAFHRLPEAMQVEAVLLLTEMDEPAMAIAARLDVGEGEVHRLRRCPPQPMKPGGYADFMPAEEN